MKHNVWETVDEMLVPENLSKLTAEPIASAHVRPAESGGLSGSHMSVVETNGGTGPQYVLKHIVIENDWIIRTTNDTLGREVRLWEYGVMDQLQPVVDHPIISCAKSETGWAILMHDISESLFYMDGSPITEFQNQTCLERLSDIHAKFWQDSALQNPELGLTDLYSFLSRFAPKRCRPEKGTHFMVDAILDGWDRMDRVVKTDIVAVIHQWLEDPQPLVDALRRYPQTLVHGDYWVRNVGIRPDPEPKIILFDWQIATVAPPAMDLIWWLATATEVGNLPVTNEEAIDIYKNALASRLGPAFSEEWWQPQLDLSLCVGFLHIGWVFASRLLDDDFKSVRADWRKAVAWWSDRVRIGLNYL